MAQEDINGAIGDTGGTPYPVQFSVAYPESSNRLTVLVRLILAVPIFAILGLIAGTSAGSDESAGWADVLVAFFIPVGGLPLATMLMILFRQKYPRWWFDWNLELNRFIARVFAYLLLLRDEYPSTDEQQSVSLEIAYPDVQGQLNRFLPIIKWFLAIPHCIILVFLFIAALIVTIIAWVAILIVGRYPRGLFSFVEGVYRWEVRVVAYAFIMTTDRYPPFRIDP